MCTAAHRLLRLRERLDQASGRHNLRLAGHRHRRPRVQRTHGAQRLERDLRRLGEEAAEVEPGLLDEEANRRRHAHPPVLDLSGGRATHSLSAALAPRVTGLLLLPPPPCASTRTGCCHTGTSQRCPSGPRACRQSPAPRQAAACRQEAQASAPRRWQRVSTEGVAHSSAICMFARAGAAGATGAWNDCTKVVARTCHSQRERQGVSSGSPCCCSDGTAALRAASQGVDPPPKRPSVPPPPQGSPRSAGSAACLHV